MGKLDVTKKEGKHAVFHPLNKWKACAERRRCEGLEVEHVFESPIGWGMSKTYEGDSVGYNLRGYVKLVRIKDANGSHLKMKMLWPGMDVGASPFQAFHRETDAKLVAELLDKPPSLDDDETCGVICPSEFERGIQIVVKDRSVRQYARLGVYLTPKLEGGEEEEVTIVVNPVRRPFLCPEHASVSETESLYERELYEGGVEGALERVTAAVDEGEALSTEWMDMREQPVDTEDVEGMLDDVLDTVRILRNIEGSAKKTRALHRRFLAMRSGGRVEGCACMRRMK